MDAKLVVWIVVSIIWFFFIAFYFNSLISYEKVPGLKRTIRPAKNHFCQGTDINKVLFNVSLAPASTKSFIFLTSVDRCSRVTAGGDFWWVRVLGPASFVVPLIYTREGIYTRVFKIPLEGSYKVSFMLEFSNYDAEKDPPSDWFIKGGILSYVVPQSKGTQKPISPITFY